MWLRLGREDRSSNFFISLFIRYNSRLSFFALQKCPSEGIWGTTSSNFFKQRKEVAGIIEYMHFLGYGREMVSVVSC